MYLPRRREGGTASHCKPGPAFAPDLGAGGGKLRAARRAGTRQAVARRVCEGMSVFVWGARDAKSVGRGRERLHRAAQAREPPTRVAVRWSLTLPLTETLVGLRLTPMRGQGWLRSQRMARTGSRRARAGADRSIAG